MDFLFLTANHNGAFYYFKSVYGYSKKSSGNIEEETIKRDLQNYIDSHPASESNIQNRMLWYYELQRDLAPFRDWIEGASRDAKFI